MALSQRCKLLISALLMTGLLSACGGGGGGGTADSGSNANTATLLNTTADQGFNWINTRRQQIGLTILLKRDTVIDKAAQNHSIYQVNNNIITHDEISGLSGFTGTDQLARLKYVAYPLASQSFGEVIARAPNSDGAFLADELIAAIYHRFIIFEPLFTDAGSGAAISRSGDVYFTTDFATSKVSNVGIGIGNIVNYPYDGQSGVPTSFLSDSEEPDPVPNINEVGYPISVHSDITGTLTVNMNAFTVRLHGAGSDLPVRLLTAATDANTKLIGPTAAAIIPLAPLQSGKTYDVAFSGVVSGIAVTRTWSFTTK